MTTHYIDMDFVDAVDTNAASYGLTEKVFQVYGPGGGNPIVQLVGSYDQLTDYIWNEYCQDDEEDAEFVCSLIEELQEA